MKKTDKLIIIGFVCFITIFGYFYKASQEKIKKNGKCTIGKIINIYIGAETSSDMEYLYYVNRIRHTKTIELLDYNIGDKVLVQYDSVDPENSRVIDTCDITNEFFSPANCDCK